MKDLFTITIHVQKTHKDDLDEKEHEALDAVGNLDLRENVRDAIYDVLGDDASKMYVDVTEERHCERPLLPAEKLERLMDRYKKLRAELESQGLDIDKLLVNPNDETLRWNTKALYREEGQIIRAKRFGKDVIFNDISRDIFAVLEDCSLIKHVIMHRYLHNMYRLCTTPEESAMARTMDRDQMPVTPEESL